MTRFWAERDSRSACPPSSFSFPFSYFSLSGYLFATGTLVDVTPTARTTHQRDRRFARVRMLTRTIFVGSGALSVAMVGYLSSVTKLHTHVTHVTTTTVAPATTTTTSGSSGGVVGSTTTTTTVAPTTTTTTCTTSPSGTTTCY